MSNEKIVMGNKWEAIGPFPSGMREHPLTASPLAAFFDTSVDPDVAFARLPCDVQTTWPSELGYEGRIGWTKFETGSDGWLEVSYPDTSWDQLRSDHGWAALQFQSVLRTTIIVPKLQGKTATPIRVDLVQGTEFALIPSDAETTGQTPTVWYQGDVYQFAESAAGTADTHSQTSNFARSLAVEPGEYVFLVRAMYEIRMFGDPGLGNPPVIRVKVRAEVDQAEDEVVLVEGLSQVPQVVDGWLMGDWLSIGLRVPAGGPESAIVGAAEVVVVEVEASLGSKLSVELPRQAKIVEGQTRSIAIKLTQYSPLPNCIRSLDIRLKVKIGDKEKTLVWHPTLQTQYTSEDKPLSPFVITFASPSVTGALPSQISHAMVKSPQKSATAGQEVPPVILALHGAGVDIKQHMWAEALPNRPGGWAILPSGKNEWGEDWHGGSMEDVWAAREALSGIIGKIGLEASDQTILMGHSNGGQGAWHIAARYPDRVHYVPYTETYSNHYADPALLGILHSALTPYNNNLHASNLSNIPIVVVHGANDDNVPPRHSRAHVALISAWAGQRSSSVTMVEIPKMGHWWDEVLNNEFVIKFIEDLPRKQSWDEQRRTGYTLTVGNPQECGGRAGIRVVELDIPGRLARLDVNARQWRDGNDNPLDLRGTNIRRIELNSGPSREVLTKGSHGVWTSAGPLTAPRAYGPMIRLLSTLESMTIVVSLSNKLHRSIAIRMANDLFVYHRVDCEIIGADEGLERTAQQDIGEGTVIVIGRPDENRYAQWLIAQEKIPLTFPTKSVLLLNDKLVYDRGAGVITLHPHPTSARALSVLIAGNADLGTELAARLFPIRTGVPIPDWAIVSHRSRWQAAGGLIGAGFWGADWEYSEAMSWMDR
ncbi:hypothetical protein IAR55_001618 [Kwoniella newhampshirensis]|uniref:Peptidase S9 prolyl oligopeptidase catalytic domain-containing protein n=1 Tax=Kwoniella newhampshirensis TaxID=1651941 RepID=A0AAW0Z2P2_9TREE